MPLGPLRTHQFFSPARMKAGRLLRQENGDKRIEPFFCPHSLVDWIGPVRWTWRRRRLFRGWGDSGERQKEALRELRRPQRKPQAFSSRIPSEVLVKDFG